MTRSRALKIVAADAAAKALANAEEYQAVGWEDYPEIGENDWDQVSKLVAAVSEKLQPHEQDVAEALELLESYAEKEA
jgi:hypothetical protein